MHMHACTVCRYLEVMVPAPGFLGSACSCEWNLHHTHGRSLDYFNGLASDNTAIQEFWTLDTVRFRFSIQNLYYRAIAAIENLK
jgi:hypothetical protein